MVRRGLLSRQTPSCLNSTEKGGEVEDWSKQQGEIYRVEPIAPWIWTRSSQIECSAPWIWTKSSPATWKLKMKTALSRPNKSRSFPVFWPVPDKVWKYVHFYTLLFRAHASQANSATIASTASTTWTKTTLTVVPRAAAARWVRSAWPATPSLVSASVRRTSRVKSVTSVWTASTTFPWDVCPVTATSLALKRAPPVTSMLVWCSFFFFLT